MDMESINPKSKTIEVQRQLKRERARREKLMNLPRPKFDGFADKQSSCQSIWGLPGMEVEVCSDEGEPSSRFRKPCPALVTLYAEIGLHRYNLLHRTNFKFFRVVKYSFHFPMRVTSYFITFLATDPADASSSPQTFDDSNSFALSVCIARRLGDGDEGNKTRSFYRPTNFPEWPPENHFYLPEEAELQRYGWVRLYLQLAVAMTDRLKNHDLTNGVEILKVAFDTQVEGLNATVFIRYKDFCAARVGNDVDRIAIVRRRFDELTGSFTVEGQRSAAPEKDRNTQSFPFSPSNPIDFHHRLILEDRNQSSAAGCSTAV